MNRADAFKAIDAERERQWLKWNRPHDWGYGDCSSTDVDWTVKSMVLTEECGEVARAILDLEIDQLREELVQVAAVAVAWLESM
jgi:hypothetical protein